jgi:hypothetical protein
MPRAFLCSQLRRLRPPNADTISRMNLLRTVKRYRETAAEYWRRAEAARQPSDKAEYREIAESYEKRADEIEMLIVHKPLNRRRPNS